jgi:glycerol-3-phosphate O-acyltransferase/dihydroxyacetone phosphate acyltransferase
VFVDIGEPITINAETVQMYQNGGDDKRAACGALLEEVSTGLRSVTIQAKDFDTLQLFRLMRRLHSSNVAAATGGAGNMVKSPSFSELVRSPSFTTAFNSAPPLEKHELVKAFSTGWEKIQNEPEAQLFADGVLEYRRLLRNYGVPDYRIAKAAHEEALAHSIFETSYLVVRTTVALLQLCVCAMFVIPGAIIAFPMTATTRYISQKEAAKAVKKSSVKIVGRDLLATWKIMVALVLVPVLHLVYTFVAFLIYGEVGAVSWFFFAPFMAAVGVFSTELGVKLFYSVAPLLKAAIHPEQNAGLELVAKRKALQRQVAVLVEKFRLLKGPAPASPRNESKGNFD